MSLSLTPAQTFEFIRHTAIGMDEDTIRWGFAELYDKETVEQLVSMSCGFRVFLEAAEAASGKLIADNNGGSFFTLSGGYDVVAYRFDRHRARQSFILRGGPPAWLTLNDDIAQRLDMAITTPSLKDFFLRTAADHILAEVEAFVVSLPGAREMVDGVRLMLAFPSEHFAELHPSCQALPFMDLFNMDFVVSTKDIAYEPR